MNNSQSINLPVNVYTSAAEKADKVKKLRDLAVRGVRLEVEEYESGYISITNPAFDGEVAGKASFHYTDHTRGFLTGLASVKDNPNGVFKYGFHCAEGIKNVLLTHDEKRDARGRRVARIYVNWNDLCNPMFAAENADEIALLAAFGITRPTDATLGGNWLLIGAKDRALYPMWVNQTESWDEFVAYMAENHPGIEQGTDEWKEKKEDLFDHKWNISHKHEGINDVISLLKGEVRVGIQFRLFRNATNPERLIADWDKMMNKHFNGLFDLSPEQRAERKAADNEQGDAYRRLRGRTIQMTTNPDYKASPVVVAAKDTGLVTIFVAPGETGDVSIESLVGKKFQPVYLNGDAALNASLLMLTRELVLAALDTCAGKGALLKVVG